jgi:hypothetical protein
MALETTASIISNFESNLPTNSQGQITAEVLRTEMKRLASNMRQSIEDIVLINPSDETDKTVFKRQDIKDLKDGKPIVDGTAKTAGKSLTHPGDESTFIKQKSTAPGRVDHVVSNKTLLQMTTGSFIIGNSVEKDTPIKLVGNTLSMDGETSITGSTVVSGSTTISGSVSVNTGNEAVQIETGTGGFAVNNLLDLLANFSSSGVPTTGPESGVNVGDINLDGQVNVTDLLLGLAGYGNPNTIANSILIPPNVNHQLIGPTITILSPVSMSISTGSFVSITV